jgi:uncharacterized protein (DUF305 family)
VTDVADTEADAPEAGGADGDQVAPGEGWTTAKVVGLVAAVGFIAVLLALALQSRFDGQPEDSVDVGFMRDMITHHEQAIQLGLLGVDNGQDDDVGHFAQEAIVAQQWEVGYMTALLQDWGYDTGSTERDGMVWMDMATPLGNMPGMASDEQMAAFRDMRGAEADAEFLRLMTAHHVGGVHMAEDAAERANDDRVVALAERMARNQQREIQEYRRQAQSMGIELEVD